MLEKLQFRIENEWFLKSSKRQLNSREMNGNRTINFEELELELNCDPTMSKRYTLLENATIVWSTAETVV